VTIAEKARKFTAAEWATASSSSETGGICQGKEWLVRSRLQVVA